LFSKQGREVGGVWICDEELALRRAGFLERATHKTRRQIRGTGIGVGGVDS